MKTTSASRRWDLIGALFDEALEKPPAERPAWLRGVCVEDSDLLREVERMLAAHERTAGILERSLDGLEATFGEEERMTVLKGRVQDRQIGPYRILREAGHGGMGVVYQALDPRLDRYVALKFLPPPLRAKPDVEKRFLAEAKASSALDHPNICTIYDIGEAEDGQLFIAMAFYEGETVAQRLEEGPLPVEEAVDLALQVAEGLARSHEAGIVHRDIKPSNVMVTERGMAKILDFGVAKLEGTKATRPGSIVGTVFYMSPEQLQGGEADHRTDLWSLGAVLYEMLTGRRAFGGDHPVAILHAILHEEPAAIGELRPEVPEALAGVVTRALRKSPDERYQTADELAADLRALRSARQDGPRAAWGAGNLPPELPGFVGRKREIAQVRALLLRVRLVTLTGAPGTGKTRLSIEVARSLAGELPDGAFFVDLTPLHDPELVASAILHALGLPEAPSQEVLVTLKAALRPRRLLLLLDNFEQVAEAAGAIAELLAEAPGLKVLATSRVVLRLSEEYAYPVPPLELPRKGGPADLEELSKVAAVALFVERARAAKVGFELTESNAAAVAEIAVRLEGMPLAIELAAARIRLFSPEALLARLGQRLDLLKTGARDRPERHRTLRQAIAWSYDLLSAEEKGLFRRLAVFVGGSTLTAAEAIAAVEVGGGPLTIDPVDGLAALVDQSLLRQQEAADDGEPRFQMFDIMREFGREELRKAGEWQGVARAHAEHFLALAEEAGPQMTGPRLGTWLKRLAADHDNLRASLEWAERHGETEMALRMTSALWRFWQSTGFMHEGRRRLESAAELPGAEPGTKVEALHALGMLTQQMGRVDAAWPLLRESLDIYRELGDERGVATALASLGWAAFERNDYGQARSLSEEALALHRRLGEKRGAALALNNLGWTELAVFDLPAARRHLEESLALRREIDDRRGVAFALANLARLEVYAGCLARAEELSAEAVEVAREIHDRLVLHWAMTMQGLAQLEKGEAERALELIAPTEEVWREVGHNSAKCWSLTCLGQTFAVLGETGRAEVLLAEAVDGWRELKNRWGLALALAGRVELARALGERDEAVRALRESLELRLEIGDRKGIAECLEWAADLAADGAAPEAAVRLLPAAQALREKVGAPVPPRLRERIERLGACVRERPGEDHERLAAEGRRMAAGEAAALAFEALGPAVARGFNPGETA